MTIVEDGNLPEEKPARSRLPGRSLSLLLLFPLLVATIWCAGQLGLQVVAPPVPPINPVRTADYQPWPYDSFSAINPLLVTLIAQQDGTAVAGIRVVGLPTATPASETPSADSSSVLEAQTQVAAADTAIAQANTVDPTLAGTLTATFLETSTALTETLTATLSGTASETATQTETPTGTRSPSPTSTNTPSPSTSPTATATGSASPTRTLTATPTGTPPQALNAAFAANPQVGPSPLAVAFTNLSTGPIESYLWAFGDGTLSSDQNPSHTYNDAGTYTVTLTVFGSGGGLASASTLIIVAAPPSPTGTFTSVPSTNTLVPPTNTPVPSTSTPVPPTDTPVVPTNTPIPPTNTFTPSFTPSFTNTFTPSFTPSFTLTATPTFTPTITPTPTMTFTPRPTTLPGSTCPQWDEPDAGAPDGNYCDLAANASYIFDFSSSPIVTAAGYDLVFYEYGYPDPPTPYILMDRRFVDVGTSPTGPWITVFNWGNHVADTNTNVGAAGYGAGNEAEDANIPMSVLYGTLPFQTGIAIDVDPIAGPGVYPYVRVRSYNGASNIDAVQVLNTGPVTADLELSMIVSDANPLLGTNVTYTVTLTNNSASTTTNVEVSDVLPAGLMLVTSSASQGSYAGDVWTVGTVPGGGSVSLDITARVVGTPGDSIINTATITTSDLSDPDLGNNSASASLTIQITPVDLALAMSLDNPNPVGGSGVTYTLTVTNTNGAAAVSNVQITNVLQTGLTPGAASVSQGSYVGNTWNVGFLSAGASVFLTLPATVEVGYAGATLNHSASITTANQPDPNAANNAANAAVVVQSADLRVDISVDNPTPAQNSSVVYTITVTNDGPNTATGIVVNAPLPADVTYVSDSGSGAYNLTTWTVGSLTNGASATLNINVVAGVPTTVSFPVSLQPSEPGDINPSNDSDSVDMVVIPPPVAAFSIDPVSGEEPLQITITNTSSGNITSYSWDFGDGVGTSTEQNPPDYVYITPNTYDVTLTVTGPGGTDVETVQVTVILRQTDVSVTITADTLTPLPGGAVVYTVQVTNNGPRDTSGVTATLSIPPGLTVDSASPAQGSYAGGVWTLDPIAAGTTQTLTLNTTVGGSVPPATLLDVSVVLSTPNHTDTDASNNSDTELVTVQ